MFTCYASKWSESHLFLIFDLSTYNPLASILFYSPFHYISTKCCTHYVEDTADTLVDLGRDISTYIRYSSARALEQVYRCIFHLIESLVIVYRNRSKIRNYLLQLSFTIYFTGSFILTPAGTASWIILTYTQVSSLLYTQLWAWVIEIYRWAGIMYL